MGTVEDTESAIDGIIASVLAVQESDLDGETSFGPDGLDAESLDIVEMAEMIEERFGVFIPDEDLQDIETVSDVREYVAERME